MNSLTLALDWTPNINHIGFFVAQEKGFYADHGVSLEIIDPSLDDYAVTPAKKVELGVANFALCPTESIISYQTKKTPFSLVAIAAVLQEDLSAIVVKEESGINTPKDLDSKSYASYKARYEDAIVQQMIQNDGGIGNIHVHYPEKLGIWDTIANNTFDSTWIFVNWEGVEAAQNRVTMNYFKMSDYDIPYSYSPVIAADKTFVDSHQEAYKNFLKASKQGFLYAKTHPAEAIAILKKQLPEKDKNIDLEKALAVSADAFGDANSWGMIDKENIETFLNWIYEKNLETQPLETSDVYINLYY